MKRGIIYVKVGKILRSKYNNTGFTANDFEMMLNAYKRNGKVTVQYYKSYNDKKSSNVIKNKEDKVIQK